MTINSESGKSYEVNLEKVTCTCPDFVYRRWYHDVDNPERLCKHLLKVKDKLNFKKSDAMYSMKGKHDRADIEAVINFLSPFVLQCRLIEEYEYCGSYRRGKDIVGDIDLLIASDFDNASTIFDLFEKYFEGLISKIVKGTVKASYTWIPFIQIDIRIVPKNSYVFALMHSTGSVEENIRLRKKAKFMGLTLNEYGLYKGNDEVERRVLEPKSEKDVYDYLKEEYKEPKNR